MSKKEEKKGIKLLRAILKNPLIKEKDFKEMKFSIRQNLGIAYISVGLPDKAIKQLYACTLMHPKQFDIWYRLGNLLLKQNHLDIAEYCYKRCLGNLPSATFECSIVQKLVEIHFLKYEFDECIGRIDFLLKKNFNFFELSVLKLFIYQMTE